MQNISGRLWQWWSTTAGVSDGEFVTELDNQMSFNWASQQSKFIQGMQVNIRVKDVEGNMFWIPQVKYRGSL